MARVECICVVFLFSAACRIFLWHHVLCFVLMSCVLDADFSFAVWCAALCACVLGKGTAACSCSFCLCVCCVLVQFERLPGGLVLRETNRQPRSEWLCLARPRPKCLAPRSASTLWWDTPRAQLSSRRQALTPTTCSCTTTRHNTVCSLLCQPFLQESEDSEMIDSEMEGDHLSVYLCRV